MRGLLPCRSAGSSKSRGTCLPFGLSAISLASWNARGFFALEPVAARRKLSYLRRLLKGNDVVMMQEAHGSMAQWNKLVGDLRLSHLVLYSSAGDFRQGGVAFFFKVSTFPLERFMICFDELVPGRAAAALVGIRSPSASFGEASFLGFGNVHVHQWEKCEEERVFAHIKGLQVQAKDDAAGLSGCFLVGDFNYRASGESSLRLGGC